MSFKSDFILLLLLLISPQMIAENDFAIGDNQLFLHQFKANGVFNLKEKKTSPASASPSTWSLSGEKAIVQGDQYQLSGFEMEIISQERGKMSLLSANCDFDRLAYEIKSNAAILLRAEGLQISGLGYDVYRQDEQVMLVIRSTVQIHFQKEKIKKLSGTKP